MTVLSAITPRNRHSYQSDCRRLSVAHGRRPRRCPPLFVSGRALGLATEVCDDHQHATTGWGSETSMPVATWYQIPSVFDWTFRSYTPTGSLYG